MTQVDLFSIPDGAWARPGDSQRDGQLAPDSGEREFGEHALNDCVIRAAQLRHDFGQFQMEHTIPSLFPAGSCPRWTAQSSGAKKQAIRMQYLSIYAYLALRVQERPELRAELVELRGVIGCGFDEFIHAGALLDGCEWREFPSHQRQGPVAGDREPEAGA